MGEGAIGTQPQPIDGVVEVAGRALAPAIRSLAEGACTRARQTYAGLLARGVRGVGPRATGIGGVGQLRERAELAQLGPTVLVLGHLGAA